MANQNSNELVDAIDIDTGRKVWIPASETMSIRAVPLAFNPHTGRGNQVIPATYRFWGRKPPHKLTGIRTVGVYWPVATWRDDDGARGSCVIRNELDARDPLFDSLPVKSRARLLLAGTACRVMAAPAQLDAGFST